MQSNYVYMSATIHTATSIHVYYTVMCVYAMHGTNVDLNGRTDDVIEHVQQRNPLNPCLVISTPIAEKLLC